MKEIRDGTRETNSHWTQPKGTKPIILVDFDHVITKKCLACRDRLEGDGLQKGAKEALKFLKKTFKIIVFTGSCDKFAFAKDYRRKKTEIIKFLKKNGIPFDDVLQTKPPACFIIDDRAIHHKGWASTMEEIAERMNR